MWVHSGTFYKVVEDIGFLITHVMELETFINKFKSCKIKLTQNSKELAVSEADNTWITKQICFRSNGGSTYRTVSYLLFLHIYFKYLFGQVLVAPCEIWFPDQELNPGPLHWEYRVLVTGSPGEVLCAYFINWVAQMVSLSAN